MGLRSFFGKAVGSFGAVLRKVGEFGSAVARRVGEFAAPVGGFAATVADMVGRPDIATGIRGGADWLTKFAPKAENILSKVEGVGTGMGNISNRLVG